MVWFRGEDDETSKAGKAYHKASQDPRISFDKNLQWSARSLPEGIRWSSLEEAGAELIRHNWASFRDHPDGIYFTAETMAHGGLIALLEASLEIGKDVKVAPLAHKGGALLRPFWKKYHTGQIDSDTIVEKMFSLLGKLIQRMRLEPQKVVVRPHVVGPYGGVSGP